MSGNWERVIMDNQKIIETIDELKRIAASKGINLDDEIRGLENKLKEQPASPIDTTTEPSSISPWEYVQLSRKVERPKPQDFINYLIDDFIELKGDRYLADDQAIIGGIGFFNGIPVTAIGTRKGKDLKQNLAYNFGMPHPEGYRKALRLAKQAEKFHRPVLFFVDTPGAFCGIDAEEHGISEAIARNLYELSVLKTPIITTITGEGGSGGALALSVADRIFMMEFAIFSVISPEGCASILFKDASKASVAAESLKITAPDLLNLTIIDRVINEHVSMDQQTHQGFASLKAALEEELTMLQSMEIGKILERRYYKYRSIGFFDIEQKLPTPKDSTIVKQTKSIWSKLADRFKRKPKDKKQINPFDD